MPEDNINPPAEPEQSFARHVWTTIVVIAVLVFIAYGLTFIVRKEKGNEAAQPADTTRDEIAQEFAPEQSPAQPPAEPTPDIRGPLTAAPTPPPAVLGSNTKKSEPTAQPQFKPYSNSTFGFSTMVPADAQLTVNSEKITANGPQGVYWMVTKYDNTTETLNSVEAQLRGSPAVTSVSRTNLGTLPALMFTSPNLDGGTGYALIINNRLYYLVGNFDRPELWRDWKFF